MEPEAEIRHDPNAPAIGAVDHGMPVLRTSPATNLKTEDPQATPLSGVSRQERDAALDPPGFQAPGKIDPPTSATPLATRPPDAGSEGRTEVLPAAGERLPEDGHSAPAVRPAGELVDPTEGTGTPDIRTASASPAPFRVILLPEALDPSLASPDPLPTPEPRSHAARSPGSPAQKRAPSPKPPSSQRPPDPAPDPVATAHPPPANAAPPLARLAPDDFWTPFGALGTPTGERPSAEGTTTTASTEDLSLTSFQLPAEASSVASIGVRAHPLGIWWAPEDEELRSRWIWPPELKALGVRGVVSVSFRVTRTGKVEDLHVQTSSGYAAYDLAALAAIPEYLSPPPAGYSEVPLQYTFRYGGSGATVTP